jgi:nitrogen fixation/metabolism regulation signal transduction histidine kinase
MLIIIGLSILGSYLFFVGQLYLLAVGVFLLLMIAAYSIVKYFNNVNKWISYFLLGIENEDTTLKLPAKTNNKALDEVYKGMMRINELFMEAKRDISTQEQYFHSIINQSATGLFSVNEKGRVININPTATKLTHLNEFHHINSLANMDASLPEFITQDLPQDKMQSKIFVNKQSRKLLFKISEITTQKGKTRLVAVDDISKELDNREVDTWVKLARTLSHEMMNNMTPITTLSQVVLSYYVKNNEHIKLEDLDNQIIANTVRGLQVIEERSLGLMNFVENYRKFTKLPQPQYAEIDLSQLLQNNILVVKSFPEFQHIKTETFIPENQIFSTDKSLLSQVIINLLKNAFEALSTTKIEHPKLSIKLIKKDESIQILIINNGPEIPKEIREQIFIPFYTTKENGSGIGLSLSKQIMLSMNGDIQLNTDYKNGICFSVMLY